MKLLAGLFFGFLTWAICVIIPSLIWGERNPFLVATCVVIVGPMLGFAVATTIVPHTIDRAAEARERAKIEARQRQIRAERRQREDMAAAREQSGVRFG